MEIMSSSTLAHSRLFAQQIPLDELLLFCYYCCSVTEYNIKVRSWITFDTSDSSLGYSY
ncbi:hypothetical protein YC2023_071088 [Brassica napus]